MIAIPLESLQARLNILSHRLTVASLCASPLSLQGRLLQLVLGEEVSPDRSIAQRSLTTGALVVTMPKVNPTTGTAELMARIAAATSPLGEREGENAAAAPASSAQPGGKTAAGKGAGLSGAVRIRGITELGADGAEIKEHVPASKAAHTRKTAEDFVDDSDVPPLE